MSQTPEGKVKDKVKALLKQYGVYYFMPVQVGYGMAGLDFHCCYQGHALFIETKSPSGVVTMRQHATMNAIEAAGGKVFVVRDDEDIDEVELWLNSFK